MQIYLVGGAVRDKILGLKVIERDYCVVGANPAELLAQGFKAVGKDFPVFLHPDTHEEYALARTERKTAPGYHGFSVYADPSVSLEEDLQRRDLTINAIAETESGEIIDPFGGMADLQQKLLRHVSPAFTEDPVRILRLARFAARFHNLGFKIATETIKLVETMIKAGECNALVPERILKESLKAMQGPAPHIYFKILAELGVLALIFPEFSLYINNKNCLESALNTLRSFSHPEHREGSPSTAGDPSASVPRLQDDSKSEHNLAAFFLGLLWSEPSMQPSPKPPKLKAGSKQLQRWLNLGYKSTATLFQQSPLNPETILDFFYQWDVFRRPETLEEILAFASAFWTSQYPSQPYPHSNILLNSLKKLNRLEPEELLKNIAPKNKASVLKAARLEHLNKI